MMSVILCVWVMFIAVGLLDVSMAKWLHHIELMKWTRIATEPVQDEDEATCVVESDLESNHRHRPRLVGQRMCSELSCC